MSLARKNWPELLQEIPMDAEHKVAIFIQYHFLLIERLKNLAKRGSVRLLSQMV
jgi:hypothetical protein